MKFFYLVTAIFLSLVSTIATFVNLGTPDLKIAYIFSVFKSAFLFTFICHFVGFLTGIFWALFLREFLKQKEIDDVDF